MVKLDEILFELSGDKGERPRACNESLLSPAAHGRHGNVDAFRFGAYGDIGIVPHVLAYKRTHSTNMSIQYADRPIGDFRERVDACRELLTMHGGALGTSAPSIDEIHELIGRQVFWSANRYADAGQNEACDQALQLAAELSPTLKDGPEWRRLRLKRALPKQ